MSARVLRSFIVRGTVTTMWWNFLILFGENKYKNILIVAIAVDRSVIIDYYNAKGFILYY